RSSEEFGVTFGLRKACTAFGVGRIVGPPHAPSAAFVGRGWSWLSSARVGHGALAGSHAASALFLLVSSGVSPDRVVFLCFVAPVGLVETFAVLVLFQEGRVGDHRSVLAVVLGLVEVLSVFHGLGVILVVDHRVAFEVHIVLGVLGVLDGVGVLGGVGVLFFRIIRPVVRVRFFFRAPGTVRVLGVFGRFVLFWKISFFGKIIVDRFHVLGLDGLVRTDVFLVGGLLLVVTVHTLLEGVGVLDEFLVLGGRSGLLGLGMLGPGIFGVLDLGVLDLGELGPGELGPGYLRVRAGPALLLLGPFSVRLTVETHTAFGVLVVLGESGGPGIL